LEFGKWQLSNIRKKFPVRNGGGFFLRGVFSFFLIGGGDTVFEHGRILKMSSGSSKLVIDQQGLLAKSKGFKMSEEMIVVPVQVSAVDFWSNIMGSAWESMDWWSAVSFAEGSEWDKPGQVIITGIEDLESGEEKPITKTLNIQDLVEAYSNCLAQGYRFNIEDFDAYEGDAVIQMAIFGEVVYG